MASREELNPCPKCGRRPMFGYACGEYFIVGHEGCQVCDNFREMHASREQEAEAWNRREDLVEALDAIETGMRRVKESRDIWQNDLVYALCQAVRMILMEEVKHGRQ